MCLETFMTTKNVEAKVDAVQLEIDSNGYYDMLMSQEKQAYLVLEQTLAYEEAFWKEKSKIKWDVEGDRNTSYFHKLAKVKKETKGISSLRVRDTFFFDKSDGHFQPCSGSFQ